MKRAVILLLLFVLSGCSTSGVNFNAITRLGHHASTEEVSAVTNGNHMFRADYIALGHAYRYETYYGADTGRHHGLLYRDTQLVTIVGRTRGLAFRPEITNCTTFPPLQVNKSSECLDDFTRRVLDDNPAHAYLTPYPDKPDASAGSSDEGASLGQAAKTGYAIASTAVFTAPLIVPVAAIGLPVLGHGAISAGNTRQAFSLKLGDHYDDIKDYVESLPEQNRDIRDGYGSVVITAGLIKRPVVVFGMEAHRVTWINMNPYGSCRGSQCEVIGLWNSTWQ
ncbi:hypothetical protein [Sulfuriflexus mobilis]|uniref:hypothetical protein n=1 Tax=Sulfuriflexus mobilis TaxID=1811807 RepID=UPI000F8327F1|nr:hypothetical protein [Sulfuriflexus mobilis]